jgi:RimJ/RimL family protein N-acetyltransferase
MTTAPTIETQRLILRGPDARDIDGIVDYFMSPRSQFTGGPVERDTAWRFACLEIGHWAARGYGMWSVCLKDDIDTSLGLVGCWFPEGWPEKEIGWLLWPQAEGKGIAYEAATMARDYAYADLGWTSAVSYIDKANLRSQTLADRLGCIKDGDAQMPRGEDCFVYRHPDASALMDGGMEAYA